MKTKTINNGNAIKDILRAARCIASVCDGAVKNDCQGFNKPDACIMQNILITKHHTKRQIYAMYKILLKYKNQLTSFGIDYDSIDQPEKVDYDTIKMPFGKYDGMCINDVYKKDRSYVRWLAKKSYDAIIKDAANAIIRTRSI